ncbi:MAG: hypothetical protein ABI180_08090 [Microcoleus sp.]
MNETFSFFPPLDIYSGLTQSQTFSFEGNATILKCTQNRYQNVQ